MRLRRLHGRAESIRLWAAVSCSRAPQTGEAPIPLLRVAQAPECSPPPSWLAGSLVACPTLFTPWSQCTAPHRGHLRPLHHASSNARATPDPPPNSTALAAWMRGCGASSWRPLGCPLLDCVQVHGLPHYMPGRLRLRMLRYQCVCMERNRIGGSQAIQRFLCRNGAALIYAGCVVDATPGRARVRVHRCLSFCTISAS